MKEMTIKQITDLLQKRIDSKMETFMEYNNQLRQITVEIEKLEMKMISIIMDLEPVQSLIYTQNPQVEKVFESLKRVYRKEDNGTNNKINE